MQALLEVVLPVFLVLGFGYLAAWRDWLSDAGVDALMRFTQNFAIPCLLFAAIATLDLGQSFDPALLGSFYAGATVGFLAGLFGARLIFGRLGRTASPSALPRCSRTRCSWACR